MTSPGENNRERPAVVRRSRASKRAAAQPAPTKAAVPSARKKRPAQAARVEATQPGKSDAPARAAKGKRADGARRPQTERRRKATEAPTLDLAMYTAPQPVDGSGRGLMLATGALAALGALVVVLADYLSFIVLDGEQVSPAINVWSVLAHLVLLAAGVGAGVLLITGRGGRVGLALLAPVAILSPAYLLQAIHAGASPRSHDLVEYYFGELHTTITMQPQAGRTVAIAGWAMLALAGVLAAVAWRHVAERDLLPLDSGQRGPAGAAGLAVLLAVTAYLVPLAITRIEKYTDPSGLVLTRELVDPTSVLGASGLGLAAGLVLLAAWIAAGAFAGSMTSRVTLVAALAGLAAILLYSAFTNARDTTASAELTPGPRLYLLLAAGLVAAAAAGYSATVRAGAARRLRSEEPDPSF